MLTVPERQPAHRFTLAAFGSRGDVYPLLAIGRELVRRGHTVTYAAPQRYRDLIVRTGLRYMPLRPDTLIADDNPLVQKIDSQKINSEWALRHLIFPFVEETYRDLLAAAEDSDLLLFSVAMFPGPMAAERLGMAWAVAHWTPATLNSIHDPPYIARVGLLHPLLRRSPLAARLFNSLAKVAIRSWYLPLHQLRAREGFPPLTRDLLLDGMNSPWLTLAMFPACIGQPQPDWPASTVCAGYSRFEEPQSAVPEEIMHFLDAGEPPLIAAQGSIPSRNTTAFVEGTILAARQLGRRLLLLAGPHAQRVAAPLAHPALLVAAYAPYSLVFPRACALILPGADGPIAHALQARKPMLIVPGEHAADQADGAARVVRLGIGLSIPAHRYNASTAAAVLRRLLKDPVFARKVQHIGELVKEQDGVGPACDALENVVRTRQRGGS